MRYVPYEKIELSAKLPVEEVRQRLLRHVVLTKWPGFASGRDGKTYAGKIEAHGFTIRRIMTGRNSFVPVIKGRFVIEADRTVILVTMRPLIGAIVFMSGWLGFLGVVCFHILTGLLAQAVEGGGQFSVVALIPFGLWVFVYGMILYGFKSESSGSIRFLEAVLGAER